MRDNTTFFKHGWVLLVLFMLCGTSTTAHAKPISQAKALHQAQAFMSTGKIFSRQLNLVPAQRSPLHGDNNATTAHYYVFNVEGKNGFIIVAGDDEVKPILGFSDSGTFDEATLPDNAKALLDSYASVIEKIQKQGKNHFKTPAHADNGKHASRNNIAPILKSTWGQSYPYNMQTPLVEVKQGKQHALTGCVATAMAQIMRFHQWPQGNIPTIPSYFGGSGDSLPVTKFDWDLMQDHYNTGNDSEQSKEAVAKLMRYAGQAVQMKYSATGSGSHSEYVPYAMTHFFGYRGIQFVKASNYTDAQWVELIYNELKKGNPVYYAARGVFNGGHAFVCDGYKTGGYFHFNWGWNGQSNGFFLLADMDPQCGMLPVSYTLRHEAVIGLQRPTPQTGSTDDVRMITESLKNYSDKDTVKYYRKNVQENFLSVYFQHQTGCSFTVPHKMESGLALYDGNDFIKIITEHSIGTKTSQVQDGFVFGADFGKDLIGTFHIVPVSREEGTEEWLIDHNGDTKYITAHITDTMMTLENYIHGSKLQINSVTYTGYEGDFWHYTFDITNNGERYNGPLYIHQYQQDGTRYVGSFTIDLDKNEHQLLDVRENQPYLGSCIARLTLDEKYPLYAWEPYRIEEVKVDVKAKVENIDNGNIMGGLFKVKARFKNTGDKPLDRIFVCQIINADHHREEAYLYFHPTIAVGDSAEHTYSFFINGDLFNKIKNTRFYARIVYYDYWAMDHRGDIIGFESPTYKISTGVVFYKKELEEVWGVPVESTITVPEEVTAVDLRCTEGNVATVVKNSNPNCVFLISNDDAQPGGLENANVTKAGKASNIKLHDNYDFYLPEDIKAEKVSYTRTFDSNRWSTFYVPFDIPIEQTEGLFIKEYSEEDENTIYFNDAQTICAYQPYLVSGKAGEKTFTAQQVDLWQNACRKTEGNTFDFVGNMTATAIANGYIMPDGVHGGGIFDLPLSQNEQAKAFRAYFVSRKSSPIDKLKVIVGGDTPGGIEAIYVEKSLNTPVARYSIDGRKITKEYRGIVIERMADGTTRKVMVK